MKLSLGFSPCPNDCFIFDAIVNRRIDLEGLQLADQFDAGLIIHENRFTFEAKGLKKIIDLGELWESETGAPIPLGGIVISRLLPDEVKQAVNRVIRRSVEYAFAHRDASLPFV